MNARPFEDLATSGLLWLLNRVGLHPRGYALALVKDDSGAAIGWALQGDGAQPFAFDPETDDEKFAAVEALFARQRDSAPRALQRSLCGNPVGDGAMLCPRTEYASHCFAEREVDRTAAPECGCPPAGHLKTCAVALAEQVAKLTRLVRSSGIEAARVAVTPIHDWRRIDEQIQPAEAQTQVVRGALPTFESLVLPRPRFGRDSFDASYESEANLAKRGA